ncbi:MAG: hypothetical protein OXH69_05500 [Acidobacteria bacterium]|nr:hypothetical protein [Acidobacteriota bacterium]
MRRLAHPNRQGIAKKAGIGEDCGTEIDEGRLLAEHVTAPDENVRKWRE